MAEGADHVDADEKLGEVDAIISDCESAAIEIENQFSAFETGLAAAEEQSTALTADIDQAAAEVIAHADVNQAEITAEITSLTADIGGLLASVEQLATNTEERSSALFEKMNLLDSEQIDIQQKINENVSHMQEIFQSLDTTWSDVNNKLVELRNESQQLIDTDIRELSESQFEEQSQQILESIAEKTQEQIENVTAKVDEHLTEIVGHYGESFVTGVEAVVEENSSFQQELSNQFSEMRSSTVEDMLEGADGLFTSVKSVMDIMNGTVTTTTEIADTVVDAMDQTNVGLNQIVEAIDNLLSLFGGLSLD